MGIFLSVKSLKVDEIPFDNCLIDNLGEAVINLRLMGFYAFCAANKMLGSQLFFMERFSIPNMGLSTLIFSYKM